MIQQIIYILLVIGGNIQNSIEIRSILQLVPKIVTVCFDKMDTST